MIISHTFIHTSHIFNIHSECSHVFICLASTQVQDSIISPQDYHNRHFMISFIHWLIFEANTFDFFVLPWKSGRCFKIKLFSCCPYYITFLLNFPKLANFSSCQQTYNLLVSLAVVAIWYSILQLIPLSFNPPPPNWMTTS